MSILIADGTGGSVDLPARGATREDLIAWAQGMKLAPNSAVGQLEGLSSAGAVVITDPNAKTLSTTPAAAAAAAETSETLTVAGAIGLTVKTTKLNAAAGAQALTLANGTFDGQEKYLVFVGVGGAVWTAAALGNLVGFTQFVLTKDAQSLHLRWDSLNGKWVVMGGNALLS